MGLQTGGYCLNWQFDFNTQMHWSAVEANWQLAVNPRAAEIMHLSRLPHSAVRSHASDLKARHGQIHPNQTALAR